MNSFDRRQLLNDQEESNRLMLEGWQSGLWTAMPAIVQSVDFSTMTVSAQITIQGIQANEDGTTSNVNLPVLIHLPLVFPSAGGFILTLPIAAGNEILVVFASRCIDSWWQSGGIQVPAEMRMHDISDGFAIPGPRSVPNAVTGISSTGAQLRNDAGTTYIEISASGKIKLVSPSEIDMTGNLKVTGTISATGEVTGNSATVPITLTTHVHGGVTSGAASTTGPVG